MTTETTPETRIERDSMGEMAVPVSAYYGASTMRAVLNFPISRSLQYSSQPDAAMTSPSYLTEEPAFSSLSRQHLDWRATTTTMAW